MNDKTGHHLKKLAEHTGGQHHDGFSQKSLTRQDNQLVNQSPEQRQAHNAACVESGALPNVSLDTQRSTSDESTFITAWGDQHQAHDKGPLKGGVSQFDLGAHKEFLQSSLSEKLPGGGSVDWTPWHKQFVLSAKKEFEQLLAHSPELESHSGAYGASGSIKLQLDVRHNSDIQLHGIKDFSSYGGGSNASEVFRTIAEQAFENLHLHGKVPRFPLGSRRDVNHVEITVNLGSTHGAQWRKDDHERTDRH